MKAAVIISLSAVTLNAVIPALSIPVNTGDNLVERDTLAYEFYERDIEDFLNERGLTDAELEARQPLWGLALKAGASLLGGLFGKKKRDLSDIDFEERDFEDFLEERDFEDLFETRGLTDAEIEARQPLWGLALKAGASLLGGLFGKKKRDLTDVELEQRDFWLDELYDRDYEVELYEREPLLLSALAGFVGGKLIKKHKEKKAKKEEEEEAEERSYFDAEDVDIRSLVEELLDELD
jgi:hypothetical protein